MTVKPMNPRSVLFREASRFEINSADARCNGSNPEPRRLWEIKRRKSLRRVRAETVVARGGSGAVVALDDEEVR